MKAQSAATLRMDPYKAGVDLGKQLAKIAPEVVIVFTSIHYSKSADILKGLRDVVGSHTLIIGASGDGVMEQKVCSNMGAVAMGLNGEKQVRWALGHAQDVRNNTRKALLASLQDIRKQLGKHKPKLFLVLSDFQADGDILEETLQNSFHAPVIGGLAGDDNAVKRSRIYVGDRVLNNSLAVLAFAGEVRYSISMARAMKPIGRSGVVTGVKKNMVVSIDNVSARSFMERELGKPLMQSDVGQIVFRLERRRDGGQSTLRSIMPAEHLEDGSVKIFGSLHKGEVVQLCVTTPKDIADSTKNVGIGLKAKDIAAGLVISCSGRKRMMGNRAGHEFEIWRKQWGNRLPVCGFASFGEIGPIALGPQYSPTLFHNMTSVLLSLWK
jgi:hypothetical protein